MYKRSILIFIALMLVSMPFSSVSGQVSAQPLDRGKEKIIVDGQELTIKELGSTRNGVYNYEFNWEDGSKEMIQIGKSKAVVIDEDGIRYDLERDLKGDVYVNGEKVTETVYMVAPNGSDDPGDGGSGNWTHYKTEYKTLKDYEYKVSIIVTALALLIGVSTGLLSGIASTIAQYFIPQVWIKIDKYHRFTNGNLKLEGRDRIAFYRVSNYTDHIKTIYHGPYQLR